MTRPGPAEGFRRLVVSVGGRRKAVDVPALTRDELVSAVREQARQGTISFAERDRMVGAAMRTLNEDGTRREQAREQAREQERVTPARARSTQQRTNRTSGRAAPSRTGRSR